MQHIDGRAEHGGHKFVNVCDFYNEKDLAPGLTRELYRSLSPLLPSKLHVKSISKYQTFARYRESEGFGLHTDTGIDDPETGTKSAFTLLIYLNDDFEGGGTQFYNDAFKPTIRVQPEAGMALFFDIRLWHAAEKVTSGTKYWMGSELMA